MSIQSEIREQMVEAMRARDALRLSVLRGLLTAFTNELVAKKPARLEDGSRSGGRKPDESLADEEAISVISRQAKQRKDSIEQYQKGGRPELAEAEKAELSILETFLPAQMSEEEINSYVEKKQAELGVMDKTGANQLMGAVMKDLKGKADGTLVKAAVDKLWS
ncbi:MAG: GatB/YqeY domain-containing protein [bacterium]|nr:GatB/YqeY domain-containing protein [bacterium]